MEIATVRAHALSSPIDPVQERRFLGGRRRIHKRDTVVVIVETTDGLRGIAPAGASSSAMNEYYAEASQEAFAETIRDIVGPAITGIAIEDPADLARVTQDLPVGQQRRSEVTAALDIAMHDLWGRRHGTSVASLLADRHDTDVEDEMHLYASAGMYMQPEGYLRQATILAANGFTGYKYRPGIGPRGDRRIVELLAEHLRDCAFAPDAHTWWKTPGDTYDRETVIDLIQHAGEHGAAWVEEPVTPSDHEGYAAVSELGVPIAGGESEPSPEALLALAQTGHVDILQGDVRHHAGFSGCWEVIDGCRDLPIRYVPHHFGTWLGLIANAQLIASVPGAELLEYPVFADDPLLRGEQDPGMYPFPLAFDIIEEEPDVSRGTLTLPDGPGLGVELNESVIEDYPYEPGPWTEFITETA